MQAMNEPAGDAYSELLRLGRLALAHRRQREEDRKRTDDAMRRAAAAQHWGTLQRLCVALLPGDLPRWSNTKELPDGFDGFLGNESTAAEWTRLFTLELTPPGLAPVRRRFRWSGLEGWKTESDFWLVVTYRLGVPVRDGDGMRLHAASTVELHSQDWPKESDLGIALALAKESDLGIALALAEESEARRLALLEVAEGGG